MERLLILGDANLLSTKILIREILAIMNHREDIELAGVVDTARSGPPGRLTRSLQSLAFCAARKIFNPRERFPKPIMQTVNLYDICRKACVRVIVPGKRDVNNQDFVNWLKETIRPTLGLSIGCCQVFKKPLIDVFEVFVNYHNGILPHYKGLSATAWSLYFNEEHTGFSYHLINEGIDAGNILVQDAIRSSETEPVADLEFRKTMAARAHLERVMEMMIRRESGSAHQGAPGYFGKKELEALTTIDEPSRITSGEMKKRLRIFGALRLKIHGEYYGITKFRTVSAAGKGGAAPLFVTQDNVVLKPIRISWLPVHLYMVYRAIRRLLQR